MESVKQEIERRAAIQRHLRQQARPLTGMEKHTANLVRIAGRHSIRLLLLAYAYLRDVPYTRVERNARIKPEAAEICAAAEPFVLHRADANAVQAWLDAVQPYVTEVAA